MKIGEALIEIEDLKRSLLTLKKRLIYDKQVGRPFNYVVEQAEKTSNRLRDLEIALNWTYQHLMINQVPLGSYIFKSQQLERNACLLEDAESPELREKIDALYEAKKQTSCLLQTVYWAYDLLLPEITSNERPKEET